MKLSQELNDAMCQQVAEEISNSIKYLSVASAFENLQLKHLSKYFMNQSNHEKSHADKFLQYINDRTGGNFKMPELDSISIDVSSIESIAFSYVKLEEQTSDSIEDLYSLAISEKSYMDLAFLQSMLQEQVEEENQAIEFQERITKTKDLVIFDATFGD